MLLASLICLYVKAFFNQLRILHTEIVRNHTLFGEELEAVSTTHVLSG